MSGIDEIKTRILFQASTLGSKESTKAMQDEAVDLNAEDHDGNPALTWAA